MNLTACKKNSIWVNACDGEGYSYFKYGSICAKYHHLLDTLVNKNTYK